jgi:LysM repeat protein
MKEGLRVSIFFSGIGFRVIALVCGGLLSSGCVLNEKYEAEKARSLNFQRLLAQEEKRTAELDNEVKRSKKDLSEYETRNRELSAQVQAVREQMARVQEEADAIKEAALLERKAKADMKRSAAPIAKAPEVEGVPGTIELTGVAPSEAASTAATPVPTETLSAASKSPSPNVHIVKPGETLYRISRRYGVRVETLRKWNKLPDDIIEVGQQLIVSQQ